MTATETLDTQTAETNPGQADGSHREETVQTGADEGTSQTSETNEGQETVSEPDAVSVLREQLREREEANQRLVATLDAIDADPDASKHARRALAGQPVKSENEDPIRSLVLKRFAKLDKETTGREDGPWVETMTELAKAVREETLAEVERRVGQKFKDLDRTIAGNRFEQALEANGVDRDTQNSQEFKNFQKEQYRADQRLRRLKEELPDVGGEMVALRWASRESRRTQNGTERQRLDMARGARLNSGANRGAASSRTAPVIDRYDPQRAEKLVDLMFRKNVKPEDIDFRR